MNLVVRTDISEIRRIHGIVSRFCRENRLSAELEGDLTLALEEILINIIRYAHPQGGTHEIKVWFSLEEDNVITAVEDDGTPFNPLAASEPDTGGPLEDRPIGGLGLHLVRKLMDRLEYERIAGRNRLVMWKRVW